MALNRLLPAIATSCALLAGCAHTGQPPATLQRDTSLGAVIGAADGHGTLSWKGVPYAQPPQGPLRWKAPADPLPWTTARPATEYAPACVQTGRLYGPGLHNRYDETIGTTLGQTLGAEDCLYLNIWAPAASTSSARPVIVWVHGGSNITGYTADPVYDGAALARTQDAVVVSVNYRLGIFGFLNSTTLKTGQREDDSGNFALLDIVKALEFVQREAARFGGDPGRVTLMGQSAGAVNVYALLTSPMLVSRSAPLFHRVAALSGGISTAATLPPGGIAGVQPAATWAARGEALLLQSLISSGTAPDEASARAMVQQRGAAAMANHLRDRTPDDLLTTVRTRLAPRGMAASNPIPDGWVVATDPIAAIRAGRYVRVPVLAGITRDESKLFPQLLAMRPELGGVNGRLLDDAAVFRMASRHDPDAGQPSASVAQWIPAAYLPAQQPGTGFNARIAELDRLWFRAIRDDVLQALRSQQSQVWSYQFDWDRLPAPFDTVYGAAHAFDLPFVFGNFTPSLYANITFSKANRAGRLALSDAMMRSLGAFAHRGDPNDLSSLGVTWPIWPATLHFDATLTEKTISVR